MDRCRKLLMVMLVVLIGAPLLVPLVCPWTGINVRHQDINIKTGQARFSRYVWFVRVSRRTEDTPISTALAGKTVDVAPMESWHRVNTLSPGVPNSPHYVFHGALHQAFQLRSLFQIGRVPETSRTEIATTILTMWQTNGNYFAAGQYIRDLKKTMGSRP